MSMAARALFVLSVSGSALIWGEPPSIVLPFARSSAFLGTGLEGDRAEGSGVDGETDDRVRRGPSRTSFPRLHLATHRRLPPSFPPGLPTRVTPVPTRTDTTLDARVSQETQSLGRACHPNLRHLLVTDH